MLSRMATFPSCADGARGAHIFEGPTGGFAGLACMDQKELVFFSRKFKTLGLLMVKIRLILLPELYNLPLPSKFRI